MQPRWALKILEDPLTVLGFLCTWAALAAWFFVHCVTMLPPLSICAPRIALLIQGLSILFAGLLIAVRWRNPCGWLVLLSSLLSAMLGCLYFCR